MQKCVIIIPAYRPTTLLKELVCELQVNWVSKIICVDDGSGMEYANIFSSVAAMDKVSLLKHAVNLGKGRALKSAFNYVLNEFPEENMVITVDADGQHTIQSIKKVYDAFSASKRSLILGCRTFLNDGQKNKIPLRSRFGNIMTKLVFNFLCNIDISDTQTGLRGIPVSLLPNLLTVSGDRYEYETNCLLWCKDHLVELDEVEIETIYENNNESSHFNPLRDSLKIYLTIFKYMCSSMLSVIIDYVIFFLLTAYTGNIFILTYSGRVCAAFINFILNKKVVFKTEGKALLQAAKYFLLIIFSGTISAISISLFEMIIDNLFVAKVIVEIVLFFFNFYIQKNLIFIGKKRGEETDWTSYYQKPKSNVSSLTQRITLKYILNVLKKCKIDGKWKIMELGGANSCFADDLSNTLTVEYYDIIDKCTFGVKKAEKNHVIRAALCMDLICEITEKSIRDQYNLVYSVGLVEHFSDQERKTVIKNHFCLCEKGGYILITAPTPTATYRLVRKCMEILHLWQFWDERPLDVQTIIKDIENYGDIIYAGINRKLPLTQCMVVAKRR